MSQNDLNIENKQSITEKQKKCPEYLLNAVKRHYQKKKAEDPDFLEKRKLWMQKYREENRDHINELNRIRRAKIKAKKELEKKNINTEQITTDLEKVTINS